MMKRSLTRVTALAAALLALGGVAAGTAHAAGAPACAKEQLAYLEAEDKATTADNGADAARAKVDQANKDQKKLEQTGESLDEAAESVQSLLVRLVRIEADFVKQADFDDASQIHKAEIEMYDKIEASDAVRVADIADKAATTAERILKKVPEKYRVMEYHTAEGWTERLKTNAVEARKATTAKDRTTLAQTLTTATADARTAHEAVPPARAKLKTCLQNATA